MPANLIASSPALPTAARPSRQIPAIVTSEGPAAEIAWDEFFTGQIRNPHTRAAYRRAVTRFLEWLSGKGVALPQVTPGMVGAYMDGLPGSIPSRKLHLAALRSFFDTLCVRHVVVLNPAASVRGERYQAVEGATPEITPDEVRRLLASIPTNTLSGLRDRAVIATLVYTAARAGAVAKLRLKDLVDERSQHVLLFGEKGGKRREIPVRHDLQQYLTDYLDAAGLRDAQANDAPLFRTLRGKDSRATVTETAMSGIDVCRMVKRRVATAGLSPRLSPHSFRVCTITDLLAHGGATLEEVQHLAGHADPRTTRLYDRRQRKVTRNLVERITV
jgi:integrase/recombinase XerD